jgi:hypothetical protein
MKLHGWLGLVIMVASEALLYLGVPRLSLDKYPSSIVATFFTPIMWTGYILLVDGWVASRMGASWLTSRRREFGFLALLSVLSWLLFEVYNLKLANWTYVGMPPQAWARDLGFFWSFATITPAMFETADALAVLRRPRQLWPEVAQPTAPALERKSLAAWTVVGLALVTLPPSLPDWLAPYTFALIWIGFIPLLEPVLLRTSQPSLLRLWRTGHRGVVGRWLLAGLICGLIWELWNVQALARGGAGWLYTMPVPIHNLIFGLHYGKMPVAGLLGFPPFALESFALYYFLRWALRIDLFLTKINQFAQ